MDIILTCSHHVLSQFYHRTKLRTFPPKSATNSSHTELEATYLNIMNTLHNILPMSLCQCLKSEEALQRASSVFCVPHTDVVTCMTYAAPCVVIERSDAFENIGLCGRILTGGNGVAQDRETGTR